MIDKRPTFGDTAEVCLFPLSKGYIVVLNLDIMVFLANAVYDAIDFVILWEW